ncbi:MAG: hypothetical protein H6502_00970 [Candidatus Woesearchaeota archaeon]|nr:MAG: hypothetical protein H6502_00970 [Candidatus Woesearchaeota archaeon]
MALFDLLDPQEATEEKTRVLEQISRILGENDPVGVDIEVQSRRIGVRSPQHFSQIVTGFDNPRVMTKGGPHIRIEIGDYFYTVHLEKETEKYGDHPVQNYG